MLSCLNARLLSGVFLCLLLVGCAATPQTDKLLQMQSFNASLPEKAELNDVPFFPQKKYQCGPAALATMLTYQHIHTTPDQLTDKVYIPEREGSLPIEMIVTARSFGLMTYKLSPQLSSILKEVSHGHPVLVFQNLSFSFWPMWHYAVVVGYDINKSEIILRSGTTKRHVVGLATFERTWQRAKHWAYVILNPAQMPTTVEVVPYLQAVSDLEQAGFAKKALSAFKLAEHKWPDNSLVSMALANAQYQAGNFHQAIKRYQQVIHAEKTNVQAWNNLAYALHAAKCPAAASKAISCAKRIAPDDANIADSYKQLGGHNVEKSEPCQPISCPVP